MPEVTWLKVIDNKREEKTVAIKMEGNSYRARFRRGAAGQRCEDVSSARWSRSSKLANVVFYKLFYDK